MWGLATIDDEMDSEGGTVDRVRLCGYDWKDYIRDIFAYVGSVVKVFPFRDDCWCVRTKGETYMGNILRVFRLDLPVFWKTILAIRFLSNSCIEVLCIRRTNY